MPNILDLIASDASPSEISDAIKDSLYAKSSEKLDALKQNVSAQVFDEPIEDEHETEAQAEVEDETTVEPEEESQEDG
tara:strand:+ start:12 stop:245 length:234 start_codon:yes stop_codon:yes gene_type:complete